MTGGAGGRVGEGRRPWGRRGEGGRGRAGGDRTARGDTARGSAAWGNSSARGRQPDAADRDRPASARASTSRPGRSGLPGGPAGRDQAAPRSGERSGPRSGTEQYGRGVGGNRARTSGAKTRSSEASGGYERGASARNTSSAERGQQ